MTQITVQQEEIQVNGHRYFVTHIPTATSGCWYTVHDVCEVWAAVAIDLDGTTVGWRNPPDEPWATEIVKAIRQAFGLPEPPEHPDYEENP